jgi:hypothetical protein
MTMSLTWADRSKNEESFIVYRNKQAIATLPPNSTSYIDTAFVASGKTLSYSVEAFNKDGKQVPARSLMAVSSRKSTALIIVPIPGYLLTIHLPQVAEMNTPRSMDVAGECLQ